MYVIYILYLLYSLFKTLHFIYTKWIDDADGVDGEWVWNQHIIDTINNDPSSTWKAKLPKQFEGWKNGDIKRTKLGTVVDGDHKYLLPYKQEPTDEEVAALPTDFNTIEEWPYCADITGHIRDQSSCGSCWAFGSTEAFNDRICISNVTSQEPFQQLMSTEDTNSCCSGASCGFSNGCNGGYVLYVIL